MPLHEIWLPINGYEGYYEISNLGNIKALAKTIDIGLGRSQTFPERIMKSNVASNGYLMVKLTVNKIGKSFTVHRLVALHYVPNPNGYKLVNHKDGNKLNPYAENLEWSTYGANAIHAYSTGLRKPVWEGKFNKDHNRTKPVIQFDFNGNVIKEWESSSLAAKYYGINPEGIKLVSRGQQDNYKGYIWKYKTVTNG